jgi:hypothetical protein
VPRGSPELLTAFYATAGVVHTTTMDSHDEVEALGLDVFSVAPFALQEYNEWLICLVAENSCGQALVDLTCKAHDGIMRSNFQVTFALFFWAPSATSNHWQSSLGWIYLCCLLVNFVLMIVVRLPEQYRRFQRAFERP